MQEVLDMLNLIYDKVEVVSNDRFLVYSNGTKKIIDSSNNKIMDIPDKDVVVGIGSDVYIGVPDCGYSAYDNVTLKRKRESKYKSFNKIDDNAWVVTSDSIEYNAKGLINSSGAELLPCIYKYIYLYSKRSNQSYLKAKFHDGLTPWDSPLYKSRYGGEQEDNTSYIIADSNYTTVDCLGARETGIDNIQIIVSSIKYRKFSQIIGKYKIRNMGKVVGREYDDLLVRRGLIDSGIIQSFTKHDTYNTTGYINLNGEEIVRSDLYNSITYIGNGITIVGDKNGYGVMKNSIEVVPVGTIESHYISINIPITIGIVNSKELYIGNDGRLYEQVTDAFPIYRSLIDQTVYLICLYGTWLYVDRLLNTINKQDPRITPQLRDKRQWVKV